jgi:hypothetical protein
LIACCFVTRNWFLILFLIWFLNLIFNLTMILMNLCHFRLNVVCWFQVHGVISCDLFTWDDEIEGHPPYIRPTTVRAHEPRNSLIRNSGETSGSTNPSNCNCSIIWTEVVKIVKEIEVKKDEKMKLKLYDARKTSNMYKNLLFLSWIVVYAYFKLSV